MTKPIVPAFVRSNIINFKTRFLLYVGLVRIRLWEDRVHRLQRLLRSRLGKERSLVRRLLFRRKWGWHLHIFNNHSHDWGMPKTYFFSYRNFTSQLQSVVSNQFQLSNCVSVFRPSVTTARSTCTRTWLRPENPQILQPENRDIRESGPYTRWKCWTSKFIGFLSHKTMIDMLKRHEHKRIRHKSTLAVLGKINVLCGITCKYNLT